MTIKRWATRRDSNEDSLVRMARKLGAYLVKTDIPTDYIGIWGQTVWLVEIKRPEGKFTAGQQKFLATADALGAPVIVWRTEADVQATLAKS